MSPVADALSARSGTAGLLGVALVIGLALFIRALPVDGSFSGFQIEGNPHLTLAQTIGSRFPPPPVGQVAVRAADVTVGDLLKDLEAIERAMVRAFPGADLSSLHTFRPVFEPAGIDESSPVSELLDFAARAPLMRDLMSRDGTRFLLLIRAPLDERLDPDVIDEVLAAEHPSLLSKEVFSFGHLERDASAAIEADVRLLTILILLCSTLVIWLSYRSFRAITFVLALTSAATVGALATLSILNASLNVATMLVVPTVLIVSLADAVHLLTGFGTPPPGTPPSERVRFTLRRYLAPSLLTSVTTAAALFSLLTAEAPALRSLGLTTGTAVLLAFVITFLLAPQLLQMLDVGTRRSDTLSRILDGLADRSKPTGYALLVFVPAALLLIPRLNFSTPPDHFFPSGSETTATHTELTEDFFALSTLEVLLTPLEADQAGEVASMSTILTEISDAFEALPGVYRAVSVGDVVREGRALGIPGPVLVGLALDNPYTARDGTAYRIEVRVDDAASIPALALEAPGLLEPYSDQVRYDVTGLTLALEYINAEVVKTLLYSFGLSALFVLLLIAGLTRTFRGTLAALAANSVPIAAAIVLFGVAGLELSVLSASVLVLSMGLIVDDTLHVLFRLVRRDGALGELPYGMAVTSIVVSACFTLFLVSSFSPVRILGGAIAVVLMVALVADLTLVPELLHLGRVSRSMPDARETAS